MDSCEGHELGINKPSHPGILADDVLFISLGNASVAVENPLITSINRPLSSNSSQFSKTYNVSVSTSLYWTTRGICNILEERLFYGSGFAMFGTSNSCSVNSWCRPSEDFRNNAIQFSKGSSVTNFACVCKDGYEGNPYLLDGCQGEEGNVEKCKLFTSKDLKKATNRYNKNRIIGQGGQGTVYKGMLTDGRIVAVKVSAKLDEDNLEQFINELGPQKLHERAINEHFFPIPPPHPKSRCPSLFKSLLSRLLLTSSQILNYHRFEVATHQLSSSLVKEDSPSSTILDLIPAFLSPHRLVSVALPSPQTRLSFAPQAPIDPNMRNGQTAQVFAGHFAAVAITTTELVSKSVAIEFETKIPKWNLANDLLAMVTEDSKIQLHRFYWPLDHLSKGEAAYHGSTIAQHYHPPLPEPRDLTQRAKTSSELWHRYCKYVLFISLGNASVAVENPLITSINRPLSSNSSQFSKTYNVSVSTSLYWTTRGICNILEERLFYGSGFAMFGTSNSCSVNSWCRPSEDFRNNAIQFSKGSSVTNFACVCKDGYEGNPYLLDGCQGEEGNVEKCKLFTSKDLKKATNRYNKNRIIGQGGQGTVYKGMLTDGRIVAVKVSAKLDEDNLEQFINEEEESKNHYDNVVYNLVM
ncbi:hypothetical protein LguiA_026282 [Lonicera macranthoides]